jgi:hypothetical protein
VIAQALRARPSQQVWIQNRASQGENPIKELPKQGKNGPVECQRNRPQTSDV